MDRQEVNPTDHISPVVFVLQRSIDRIVNDQFEQAEENDWYEKDLEVFRRVNR